MNISDYKPLYDHNTVVPVDLFITFNPLLLQLKILEKVNAVQVTLFDAEKAIDCLRAS